MYMLDDKNDKHQVGTNSLNAPTTEREASQKPPSGNKAPKDFLVSRLYGCLDLRQTIQIFF